RDEARPFSRRATSSLPPDSASRPPPPVPARPAPPMVSVPATSSQPAVTASAGVDGVAAVGADVAPGAAILSVPACWPPATTTTVWDAITAVPYRRGCQIAVAGPPRTCQLPISA